MSKMFVLKIIISLTLHAFVMAPQAQAASLMNQCQFIYNQTSGQSHGQTIAIEDKIQSQKLAEVLAAMSTLSGKPQKPDVISEEISLLRKFKIILAKAYNKSVVASNAFWVWRGLQTYHYGFGDKFTRTLAKFKSGDHWVDVGSGSAKALLEFLQQTNNPQIQTTAIAVSKPTSYSILKKLFLSKHPSLLQFHRYLSGQTIEELNLQSAELAPADLITDMFGAFSYSPQIDQVLAKEISMLKVGGKLFVYTPLIWQIKIFNSAGNKIPLNEWLQSLAGVKLSSMYESSVDNELSLLNGFILERTNEEFSVPTLKLINMSSEIVSERTYISVKP